MKNTTYLNQENNISKLSSKLALMTLVISAFCIGTTEFIAVGLIPDVSKTFHITVTLASILTSGYALGAAFGAPIITPLTNRMSRKSLLVWLMIVFVLGSFIATFAPSFEILMGARVLTAFVQGVFYSIASTIAADLVPEDKKASAIALVFTGLTIATITGVPAGTYIANVFGWRISFLLIAILGILALLCTVFLIPKNLHQENSESILNQLVILKSGKLLLAFLITILGYGGTFVTYTYISPILEKVMGYSPNGVTIMLLVYGVALAIGNSLGGKLSNKKTLRALVFMFLIQSIMLILFGLLMPHKILGTIALLGLGLFAFMNVPALQLYVFQLTQRDFPQSANFASALNISAFNVGIAFGSFVGSKVIVFSSLKVTPYFGALFVIIALLFSILAFIQDKKVSQ